MNLEKNDVELYDLLLPLWRSKLILLGFIITSILIGFLLFLNEKNKIPIKDPLYESKLYFTVDSKLPKNLLSTFEIVNKDVIKSEFQKLFYSQNIFKKWKNENIDSNISLEDFKETQLINKYFITKNSKFLLRFRIENEDFILIQSNLIPIFDELFNYANYVSNKLDNLLYYKFKNSYDKINEKFSEFNSTNNHNFFSDLILEQIRLSNLITEIEDGKIFIQFSHMDIPKNINIQIQPQFSYLRILVFAVFGAMLGSFFIFIRNAFSKKK